MAILLVGLALLVGRERLTQWAHVVYDRFTGSDRVELFYDETSPDCRQLDGRVNLPIAGRGSVEHAETIYRLGVRSPRLLNGCRVMLENVEPRPVDPGMQRIGAALRPRIPAATDSAEFTANPNAPAYVEVLQELVPRLNPANEPARLRFMYARNQTGQSQWFEEGDYVLTFRLEGSAIVEPVRLRLEANFDGRQRARRWVVRRAT